ncbi:MAG: InlB B-repeat-containing protein [Lachnospiraceae bacterium]
MGNMSKPGKRLYSLLLILIMVMIILPVSLSAEEGGEQTEAQVTSEDESETQTDSNSESETQADSNSESNTSTHTETESSELSESSESTDLTQSDESPQSEESQLQAQAGSISGTIWLDENEDGAYNSGEKPVADYEVSLYLASNTNETVAVVTTDDSGNYTFTNLAADDYVVGIPLSQKVGDTEYLVPLIGISGDNKFALDKTTYNAYTNTIAIEADSEANDYSAGVRLPAGIQNLSVGIQQGSNTTYTPNTTVIGFAGYEWWVIGTSSSGVTSQSSTSITLLSKTHNFSTSVFNPTTNYVNNYNGSTLQTAMTNLSSTLFTTAKGNTLESNLVLARSSLDLIAYSSGGVNMGNVYNYSAVTSQKFWPISMGEWTTIGNTSVRSYGADYWMRSPSTTASTSALRGTAAGTDFPPYYVNNSYAVRPAFYLNLSTVLFTSNTSGSYAKTAATVGSSALQAYTAPSGTIKVTATDNTNLALTTSVSTLSASPGTTASIAYSGAKTGTGKSVSVVICNSAGTILYYGRPVNTASGNASGTASVTIPSGLATGTYTLKIFNEQVNGTNYTDYASTPRSITLTVQPSYTITYNANGGTGTMASTTFTYGTSFNLRTNTFTRTGYTFLGWSTSSTATSATYTDAVLVSGTAFSKNTTLYAVWKGNSYTITYNANGGTGTMTATTFTYGTSFALRTNTFTRTGYSFLGWSTSSTATSATYTNGVTVSGTAFSANTILYAVWQVGTYTITYNANGGTGTMTATSFTYGTNFSLRSNTFTRTGYEFLGWSTSSTATSATYTDGVTVSGTAFSANTIFYAVWKAGTYTITYNANGGSGTMSTTSFTYGTSFALTMNAFTRTGYAFLGWSTSSTATSATFTNGVTVSGTAFSSNTTLYAVWKGNTCTIQFNADDGSGNTAFQAFTFGASYTLSSNSFTRTGYTFIGWATTSGGSVAYIDGELMNGIEFANSTTIDLYAVWRANTHTIIFDANSGTGTMADQTYTYGSSYSLEANTYTLSGYTFAGWSTSATGTMKYQDNQAMTGTEFSTTPITLYALWEVTATVTTKDATNVYGFGATLNGEYNLNGYSSTGAGLRFEYSTDINFATYSTVNLTVTSNSGMYSINADLVDNLDPGTTYYYRIILEYSNTAGTVSEADGGIKEFQTSRYHVHDSTSRIGAAYYLSEAVDICTLSSTGAYTIYALIDDTDMSSNITSTFKYVTIPNGYDITLTSDNSPSKTYTITQTYAYTNYYDARHFYVDSGGSLTLKNIILNGTNTGSSGGGGVYVYQGGALNMDGATIQNCYSSASGGGVYLGGASAYTTTLDMKNGATIKDCNTLGRGGGIYSTYGSASIDNTVIQDCVATTGGGAAYFVAYINSTSFSVTNSTIKDCSANSYGGLYISATSANVVTFTLSNTTIDNCKATSGAVGGLYTYYTTTTMSNTTIQNCTATSVCGGAAFNYSSVIINNGSKIKDCSANTYGGGVHMFGDASNVSALTLTDATIENCNTTNGYGGGIYSTYTNITLDNAVVDNCSGSIDGGIYAEYMISFVMKNNTKIQNCTAINGIAGGMYIAGVSSTSRLDATISDSTIYNCTATTYGGGIYLGQYSDLTLTNSTIDTCSVSGTTDLYGGGLYSAGYSTADINTVDIKNSTINDCYVISNNTTYGRAYGGGVSVANTSITLDNTSVQDCYVSATGGSTFAYTYGGGIYTTSTYGLTLNNNSKIDACYAYSSTTGTLAQSMGGGLYSMTGSVSVDNSTILDCYAKSKSTGTTYASAQGGGVCTGYGISLKNGSKIDGCYADADTTGTYASSRGGGIYSYSSSTSVTVSLDNSTISKCYIKSKSTGTTYASAQGGGVYTDYNILSLKNGSKIDDCDADSITAGTSAYSYGGGIFSGSVTVELDNSTVSDCNIKAESSGTTYAYAYGGGIYTLYGFNLDSGSKIQDCDADAATSGTDAYAYGGGVYLTSSYSSALKNSSSIAGCSVTASGVSDTQSNGGGIYIVGTTATFATLDMDDAVINNCNAEINGGGLYGQYLTLTMDGSTISGCSADNGGGIYNTDQVTTTAANSTISNNSAGADGGGVFLNTTTSTFSMTSGSIINNSALNGDGGGIYTNDYHYDDPVTSGYYSNVSTGSTTGTVAFSGNKAQAEFNPPSDASASYLSHLAFSATSQSSTATTTHILNNYDVNYRRLTVTLTYNSNVNTYSSSMTDIAKTETVNTGSVTVKDVDDSTLNFTTRGVTVPPGYEFDSWNTQADGLGTSYDPADSTNNTFTINTNTVLYAKWRKIQPSITIEKYGDQDGTTQLADAEFTVEKETSTGVWEYYMYDTGTSSWITTVNKSDSIVTTTSSGGILANLPDGTYKFTEVAPPTSSNADYSILRESFEVTVPLVTTTDYTVSPYNYTGSWQYDGTNYYYYNLTYEVTDAATLYMPTAGSGFDQIIYIAIGLFVLAFTAVIFVITRKRKALKLQVRHPKPEKTLP